MIAANDHEWHQIVCERDNYICRYCERRDARLTENEMPQFRCGHHVITKGSRPDLRLETDNGVCVCARCHRVEAHEKGTKPPEIRKFFIP